jgi:hypothetical protein
MESISFYVSLTTGILLTISETLPFIKKVKSNGILQCIIDALTKPNSTNNDESSHLITCKDKIEDLQDQINNIRSHPSFTFDKDSKVTILIEPSNHNLI